MGRKKKVTEETINQEVEENLDEDEDLLDDSPVIIKDVNDDDDVETFDQVKKRLEKQGKEDKQLSKEDVLDAVAHLDLTDKDVNDLIAHLEKKGIKIVSDNDDTSLDDLEFDETLMNQN